MEKSIKLFADHMQMKLDKNLSKEDSVMNPNGTGGKWTHCSLDWLLLRLREEILELVEAIMEGDPEAARDEAADVGNFAMMIHDNLGRLK